MKLVKTWLKSEQKKTVSNEDRFFEARSVRTISLKSEYGEVQKNVNLLDLVKICSTSNLNLLAESGFDPAENEPLRVRITDFADHANLAVQLLRFWPQSYYERVAWEVGRISFGHVISFRID